MGIGIPNIERLRSSFAMRGDAYKTDFATRYGGGFVGSSTVARSFRDDAGEMVKKVVQNDSKKINNSISSSLNQKIQDEIKREPTFQTYGRPAEDVYNATVSPDQIQEYLDNLQKEQESAKRTITPNFTDDSSIKNVAAALQTTGDGAMNNLQGFSFNPASLQNLINLSKTYTGTGMATPVTPTYQPPMMSPVPDFYSGLNFETPTTEPSNVGQNFGDLIGDIFGNKENVPEDYRLSKMNVTYTKVDPEPEDDDYEEIESVDVTGSLEGEDDEEIDSVDVTGAAEERRQSRQPSMEYAEEDDGYYGSNDPWERFKKLYLDFYAGDQSSSMLREFNRREASGEFGYSMGDSESPNMKISENFDSTSDMNRDTNDILRAKTEKDQLNAFNDMLRTNQEEKPAAPIVINNTNNTIATKSQNEPKTERVFSDDSTFNRLSMADSNHPHYTAGFRP